MRHHVTRKQTLVFSLAALLGVSLLFTRRWLKQENQQRTATNIPVEPELDSTFELLRKPYDFISERCRYFGTDCFQARMMMQNTIFLRGAEAAERFYDERYFIRQGAAPLMVKKTLFGVGAIQNTDEAEHAHRKALFMRLLSPDSVDPLLALTREEWLNAADNWTRMEKVVLYDELHHILGKAVCRWAGVPLPPEDSEKRIRQLTSLFDAAGAKSLAHVKAQVNRGALESWLSRLVTQVRNGQLDIPENSPIHVIAHFSDTQGQRYSPRIAAVELINILRPVIAVSVFIVQSIHALHQYPECRDKLLKDSGYAELFVNEVRRFYPFFPATVARVREDFTWQGFQFRKGTRTMLDLYGTNHDERIWDSPHAFRPERFVDSNTGLFQLIPQGGGDHDKTHRCPGEYLTIALMKQALNVMLKDIRYELPNQNLTIDRSRLPAIPVSRLVIQDVEVVAMNHALPASVMS